MNLQEEKSTNSGEVLDGVNDVVIILQLSKNIIFLSADVAFVKLQNL